MPHKQDRQRFLGWSRFDQWYLLSSLLDFGRVHLSWWDTVLESLSIPFAVAPSRLDNPPLLISSLPLPARLQASGKLEAWEYVGFCINDNSI